MPVELSHPDGLLRQDLYAPLAVATGSRLLFLAGQTATTPDGRIEVHDLAGQIHEAVRYVALAVRAAGGDVADIVRLTCFVVGWTEDMAGDLAEGFARAQRSEGLPDPLPPLTVIGVQALYRPQILVEVEATAVVG